VEDDSDIRAMLEMALVSEGYEVLAASNGAVALDLAQQSWPDLILLDLKMPGMNGWEFATHYRQQAAQPAPIVVLTASRDADGPGAQVEIDGYLNKPFELDELLEVVARHTARDDTSVGHADRSPH
jgi:DNA-binding response OmpR family regulator